jgi:hypothetical protein
VTVEGVDRDDLIVRIAATPQRPSDGARLAGEVLNAIAELTPRETRASAPSSAD